MLTLASMLVLSLCITAGAEGIKTSVNGRPLSEEEYTELAVLIDGEPYIPLSVAAMAAGDEYFWDGENAGFVSYDGEVEVTLCDGVPMISAATASESLGLVVKYNSNLSIISVIKPQAPKQETNSDKAAEHTRSNDKSKEFITVFFAMNEGFVVTLKLFAVTLIGALPLGLLIALCSMSKFLPLKALTRFLVWIIRGTPLMLQLLIIFFIPGMAMEGGSPWPRGEEGRFMAASVAFIINYAFYFSEIFRGGIENIPQGQVEAGQVLGMTKMQIFFHVTLVQMIKRIVPPMSNEIITLVKDTSIARIISLQEVIWAGYAFLKSSHGYSGLLWPLFFTGVYYLAFNGILTLLFGYIEKKLSYFKA